MSAQGKKKDKGFIALLVLIIVCACLMVAAVTTLGIGMSNGMGESGQQGEQGEQGVPGSKWHTDKGAPKATVGVEGDLYLDTDSGDVYEKKAGGWTKVLNIKGASPKLEIKDGYWYVDGVNTNVKAAGADGKDGLKVEIGDNGNWFVGGKDTEVKAGHSFEIKNGKWYIDGKEAGDATVVPRISDGSNGEKAGYWYIGDTCTEVKAQGESGKNGVTPSISDDGYWVVNGEKTTVKAEANSITIVYNESKGCGEWWIDGVNTGYPVQGAQGADGYTPYIDETSGEWYINGETTGVKAKGEDGKDGLTPYIEDGKWYIGQDQAKQELGPATGAAGKDGTLWFSGEGAPTDQSPAPDGQVYVEGAVEGSFYVDTKAAGGFEIYRYGTDGWQSLTKVTVELKNGREWVINGTQTHLYTTMWFSGEGDPTSENLGYAGDLYLNLTSGQVWRNTGATPDVNGLSSTWEKHVSLKGETGETGETGPTGPEGPQGTRGTLWFYGQGDPNNLTNDQKETVFGSQTPDLKNGDLYLDATRNEETSDGFQVYQYRESDEKWVAIEGLKLQGVKGERGTRLFAGKGDPNDAGNTALQATLEGAQNGDYFFDTQDGVIYTYVEANKAGEKWQPLNDDDPLAGTKWLSGPYDPDDVKEDTAPELYALVQAAKDYDVYFNTESKTLWQLTPQVGSESKWARLGVLSDQRGTKWFYGSADPFTAENFDETVPGAINDDFYLQTFYAFSGVKGFKLYVLHTEGWVLLLDMSEKIVDPSSFEIPNLDALTEFRNSVNNKDGTYGDFTGKTVTLTGVVTVPENFDAIGDPDSHVFNGTFDGGAGSDPLNELEGQAAIHIEGITSTLFDTLGSAAEIYNLDLHGKLTSNFALTTDRTIENNVVPLLANTYGLAKEIQNTDKTKIHNVRITLEDETMTFVAYWNAEGEVTVTVTGKAQTAKGRYAPQEQPTSLTLANAYILDSASYVFDNVHLNGGYINVDSATALTVKNSVIEKYRIGTGTTELHDAPIYGGYGHSLESLVLENNLFNSDRAVYMYNSIAHATIKDNRFGSSESRMNNEWAVKFMAIPQEATFDISGNTVYGETLAEGDDASFYAFDFYADATNKDHAYTVKLAENEVNVKNSAVDAGKFGIVKVESQGENGAKARVYFLSTGEGNKLSEQKEAATEEISLYKAIAYTAYNLGAAETANVENSFDFIAFKATLDEHNLLSKASVYLGSNFGSKHSFTAGSLEGQVVSGKENDVEIIDLAFEDPEGFVQHVADYTTHYYVNNAHGLASFRDMVNKGKDTGDFFKESNVVVTTQDIDLNGMNWTPIGYYESAENNKSFIGTFTTKYQGNQYAIKNLKIDSAADDYALSDKPDEANLGLFGYAHHVTLSDIVLTNVKIIAKDGVQGNSIGALVANKGMNCNVSNVTVNNSEDGKIEIQGKEYGAVGGVFGHSYREVIGVKLEATVGSNSTISATKFEGDTFVGGIVGHMGEGGDTYSDLTVKNVTITGYRNVGGIFGVALNGTTISNATVENVILNVAAHTVEEVSTVAADDARRIGALAGSIGNNHSTITVTDATVSGVELNRATNSDGSYVPMGVVFDGYVGTVFNNGSDTENVVFSGTNKIEARLDKGLYIHDGVYEIREAAGLQRFADMVTKGGNINDKDYRADTTGMTVKLMENINVADLKTEGEWEKTVGGYEYALTSATLEDKPFAGTFDGDGKAIKGLTSALFAFTDGATIENVKLDSLNVSGDRIVGGVVNLAKGKTHLIDVAVEGKVTLTLDSNFTLFARSIGGLIGAVDGNEVTLSSVSFEGELDNQAETDHLNYLVYNAGLVGSTYNEDYANDLWAQKSSTAVLAAGYVNVNADGKGTFLGSNLYTASTNIAVTATDLGLSETATVAGPLSNATVYGLLVTVKSDKGLASVAELVNNGITFENQTVLVGKTFSMLAYQQSFKGIGAEGHPFKGTFNGGNTEIGHVYGALFGNTNGATIANLKLVDAVAQGNGFVVADATATKFENVSVSAFVQYMNGVGVLKPSDLAQAPYGLYGSAIGENTVAGEPGALITVKFGADQALTFTAKIDENLNSVVAYTGDTFEEGEKVSDHATYKAVIKDETFHLGSFNHNVGANTPTAAFSFKGIKFTGYSYIDLSHDSVASYPAITSFTMENCYADVTPETVSGMFPSFILNRSERNALYSIPFRFVNNVVLLGTSITTDSVYKNGFSAIYSWEPFADGSLIKDNIFGSEDKPFHEAIVSIHGFGGTKESAESVPQITFDGNIFYSDASKTLAAPGTRSPGYVGAAIDLAPNSSWEIPYMVWVKNNTLNINSENQEEIDAYTLVKVQGSKTPHSRVFLLGGDSANVVNVNGEQIDIDYNYVSKSVVYSKFDFVGYNVELDAKGKITSGDFIFGYSTQPRETVDENDKALATALQPLVAADHTKDVHIVIGEQFGRRLSDLLKDEYNTYYNFALEGLQTFVSLVNSGNWSGEKADGSAKLTVKLADELNDQLAKAYTLDIATYESALKTTWTPIGDEDNPFRGTFDGSYEKAVEGADPEKASWMITGLTVSGEDTLVGLFGVTDGAVIKNLDIQSFSFELTGNLARNTGALIAKATNTTVSNVNVSGVTLSGYLGNAGALIGSAVGGTVENVKVTNLNASNLETSKSDMAVFGAVVGLAEGGTYQNILVGVTNNEGKYKSTNDVNVTALYEVGGVIGLAKGSVTVGAAEKPVWVGAAVKANSVTDEKTNLQIGGIVGAVEATDGASTFTFENVHFIGKLERVAFGMETSTKYENYGLVGANVSAENKATVNISNSTLYVVHNEGFEQDTDWTETNNVDSEYRISSYAGLKFFREQVNKGNSYKGETIHLVTDIDLAAELEKEGVDSWTPIGGERSADRWVHSGYPFEGTFTAKKENVEPNAEGATISVKGVATEYKFDPEAYTISNINVFEHNAHGASQDCVNGNLVGFFGYTNGGTIEYLNINTAKVTGHTYVGVLVGSGTSTDLNRITIANAVVKGHHWVGALSGMSDLQHAKGKTIANCTVVGAELTATPELTAEGGSLKFDNGDKVGGLSGWTKLATFSNNIVAEAVITGYRGVGGLAGFLQSDTDQTNNKVENTVINVKREGFTTDDGDGLMGYQKDYEYNGVKPQCADWMFGDITNTTDPASHGVNVDDLDGNEETGLNNHKYNVTINLYNTPNAESLIYDNNAWRVIDEKGLLTLASLLAKNEGGTHADHAYNAGFEGETIVLDQDYDLGKLNEQGELQTASAYVWQPLKNFKGTLDGRNHVISNLNASFFGELAGTVKNLTFTNATTAAGVLATSAAGATVENVTVNGTVNATEGNAGGLFNAVSGAITVKNVTFNGTVSGTNVGAFAANYEGATGTVDGFTFSGTLTAAEGGKATLLKGDANVTFSNSSVSLPKPAGYEDLNVLYGAYADKDGAVIEGAKAQFILKNEADLAAFRDFVNAAKAHSFAGETVILADNITLKDNWTPIGTMGNRFLGTFDGNNKTISGLQVSGSNDLGLFGLIGFNDGISAHPVVKNLTLNGGTVTVTGQVADYQNRAGLLAGYAANTTFENITLSGTITVKVDDAASATSFYSDLGGLVGRSQACTYNKISVTAAEGSAVGAKHAWSVGGLIGMSMHDTVGGEGEGETVTLSGLSVNGTEGVGGLVGTAFGYNKEVKTYTYQNITLTNVTVTDNGDVKFGDVRDEKLVGGLIGAYDGKFELKNSSFSGMIVRAKGYGELANCGLVGGFSSVYGGLTTEPSLKITDSSIEYTMKTGEAEDYKAAFEWDAAGTASAKNIAEGSVAMLISTESGLKYFAQLVNGGLTFENSTVKLAEDITLTAAWTPISGTFSGTFDGEDATGVKHSISDLTIDAQEDATENKYGFFSSLNGATVQNLIFKNVKVNAPNANSVGTIAAKAEGATIKHVHVYVGSEGLKGGRWVGGIVGYALNTILMGNSVEGALSVTDYKLGGIVGYLAGDTSAVTGNTVGKESNYATLTADGGWGMIGGLIGGTSASRILVESNTVYAQIDASTATEGTTAEEDFQKYNGALLANGGQDVALNKNTGKVTLKLALENLYNNGLAGVNNAGSYAIGAGENANSVEVTLENTVSVLNNTYTLLGETGAGLTWFANQVNAANSFVGKKVVLGSNVTLDNGGGGLTGRP